MIDSLIAWTDDTRNVVEGCTEVDEECARCYAKGVAARFSGHQTVEVAGERVVDLTKPLHYHGLARRSTVRRLPQWTGEVRLCPEVLDQMFWQLLNTKTSRRQFLCSMGDLGHAEVPDDYLDEVFARVAILESCRAPELPLHIIQMVTKRPERIAAYTRAPGVTKRIERAARQFILSVQRGRKRGARNLDRFELQGWPLRGVHLITSAGRQVSAAERIPQMLAADAAVIGVSCEPMLGPVDFRPWIERMGWLILGGESDREDPRPAQLDWFHHGIAQAVDAGCPVFMKQTGTHLARALGLDDEKGGEPVEWEAGLNVRQFPPMPKVQAA